MRDEKGFVEWECSKCKKNFRETDGLKILAHGKCDGKWGETER